MEHDWLLLNIDNPQYDAGDFHTLGINSENTQFLSKDEYKQKKFVLNNSLFADENGNFSDTKFDKFYESLASGFSVLDLSKHAFEYDPFNYLRTEKGKEENINFNVYRIPNPTGLKIGAAGINKESEMPFSSREWAEKSQVYDTATGKFLDYSPNDHALINSPKDWLLDQFKDPLVLAVWEEDGTHVDAITHKEQKHKKGELKLSPEGKPYYETLNGRSLNGKQVLSSADVFTVDGEGINKYDCFDSDDVEKNVAGVVAKNLWAVAPLFIGGPLAAIYAGILAVRELAKAAPMIDGIFGALTGDDRDTQLSFVTNTIAGKATQWTGSMSDYAQEHTLSIEGVANLLSDVALQWSQLKLIGTAFARLRGFGTAEKIQLKAVQQAEKTYFKLANNIKKALQADEARELALATGKEAQDAIRKLFATKATEMLGTPETWKTSMLGQALINNNVIEATQTADKLYKLGSKVALGHMALVSNTDVYGDMLEHGATKREALLVALASTAGMYAVDSWAGFDKLFFDEISAENRVLLRRAFQHEAQIMAPEFQNIFRNETLSKADKIRQIFAKGKELGKKASNTFFQDIKDHTASGLQKAIAEGLEEVSEELVSDLSKQAYQLAGELGADTSTTDVEAFDGWDIKKLLSRYGMNFLGGFLGGGLFYGVEQFQKPRSKRNSDEDSLIYLARNMKTSDMLNYLDKLHKLGRLGSTTLSATPMLNDDGSVYLDDAGKRVYNTAKKGEETVNDFMYKILREELMQIDGIIREYGDNLTDDDLFKTLTYNEDRFQRLKDYLQGAAYTTKYFELYQDILGKFISTERAIRDLKAPDVKSSPEYAKYEKELKKLQDNKVSYRLQLDDFKSGRASLTFLRMMLMHLDPRINDKYNKSSFTSWLDSEKGIKDVNSLNSEEYEYYKKEYLENVKPFQKEDLANKYREFVRLEKTILPELLAIQDLMKDFKAWHDQVEELFGAKSPFNFREEITFDSLINGETEESESYINRNQQLAGESPELFETRKKVRGQQVLQLQMQEDNRVINEALQILKNALFIDSATKRRLLSMVKTNKQSLINQNFSLFQQKYKELADINIDSDLSNLDSIKLNILKAIRRNVYKNQLDLVRARFNALASAGSDLINNLQTIVGEPYSLENKLAYIEALNQLGLNGPTVVNLQNALQEDLSGDLQTALTHINIGTSSYELTPEVFTYDYDFDEEFEGITEGKVSEIETFIQEQENLLNNDVDFAINEIQKNPYYRFLSEVEKLPEANNPIINIVRKLALGLNRDYKDTESLLHTIYQRASTGDTSDFLLTQNEQDALEEASDLLMRAYGYIFAAKNAPVAVNPFQHNVTVNAIAKKNKVENWEDLPVLDSDVADLYQKEIVDYLREIGIWEDGEWSYGSWRYWNEINLRDRIQRFVNSSKNYTKVKLEWLEANRKKFVGKDFDLLKGIDLIPKTNDAIQLHKVEQLFYDNVQEALKNYKDFGEILEACDFKSLLDSIELQEQHTANLTERTTIKDLTSTDLAMYILSIVAISSSDFHSFYSEWIKNSNVAPLVTLKTADRIACGLINDLRNGNRIWKPALSKIYQWSGTKALLFNNVVSIFGNGGVGKTVGCIKAIRDFVGGNKEDVWILAPGHEQLKSLQDLNALTYTIDDARQKLFGNATFLIKTVSIEGGFTTEQLESVPSTNLPKCIIIDEATHMDSTMLQALQKLAESSGTAIIAVGDDIQNGYETIEGTKLISNVGDANVVFCGRSSRLGITLRENNLLKSQNAQILARLASNLLHTPVNIDALKRIKLLEETLKEVSDAQLSYFYGDTINGDYVVNVLTEDLLSKINSKDIAFVGDTTSNAYKQLVDKFGDSVKVFTPTEIQGREFDFVFVDRQWEAPSGIKLDERVSNTIDFLRMLYTMSTRSRSATIYLDNGLSNIFKFKESKFKGSIKSFTPEVIEQFKNNELSEIESFNIQKKPKPNPVNPVGNTVLDLVNDLIDKMNTTTDYNQWKDLESRLNLLISKLPSGTKYNTLNPAPKKPEPSNNPDIEEPPTETIPIINTITSELSDQKQDLDYLAYSSVHYGGIEVNEKGDWIISKNCRNFNGLCDLQIVRDNEEDVSDGKKKRTLVHRFLSLKSNIVFGKPYNASLRPYMTKEEYENMKFFVVATPKEQWKDRFVGLSDLTPENEAFSPDKSVQTYVFRIVGRYVHDGVNCEISLGSLSNPETTILNKETILSNARDRLSKHPEEKETLTKYIENIENGTYVQNYKNFLLKLISNGELELSKENLNFVNSKASLIKLKNKTTVAAFRNTNSHLITSPICFFRTQEDGELREMLRQRAVIFVSPDTTLSPNDLPAIWADELANGKPHSVLMIKLQNRGVTLHDLNSKKYKELYMFDTSNGKNLFPFETRPMAYRMLVALWNYRADLINFVNAVQNRLSDTTEFENAEDLDNTIREYAKAVYERGDKSIEEITLSNPKFKAIEDINSALNVPRFRLGARSDAETIIRKIRDSYYGIFTTLSNALNMLESMDSILNNLGNLITVTENGNPIKREQRLGDEKGHISWTIQENAESLDFSVDGNNYQFPTSDDIRFLPLLLLKLYGRAGAYANSPSTYNWTEESQLFKFKDKDSEEYELDLKELIKQGKTTQDLLNLCLFGTTGSIAEERASDAYFKNGLYIDPMAGISRDSLAEYGGGQFVPVGNSDYSFYIEYGVRAPRINFNVNQTTNPESNPAPVNPEPNQTLTVIHNASATMIMDKAVLKNNEIVSIRDLVIPRFGENVNFVSNEDYYEIRRKEDNSLAGILRPNGGIIFSLEAESNDLQELINFFKAEDPTLDLDETASLDDLLAEIFDNNSDDEILNTYINNNCV